jgi:hypothetical protein
MALAYRVGSSGIGLAASRKMQHQFSPDAVDQQENKSRL